MKRGLFHQNPSSSKIHHLLVSRKVLTLLSSPRYQNGPSISDLLKKTLFLVALASGFRASQLNALSCSPQLTVFAPDGSVVSLAPAPNFLAKNERLDHHLRPFTLPAWLLHSGSHPLCSVATLRAYLDATPSHGSSHLFCDQRSDSPLSTRRIADIIRATKQSRRETWDVHALHAHGVRGIAASLAFLRTHSLERVREAGQWTTSSIFVAKYLSL